MKIHLGRQHLKSAFYRHRTLGNPPSASDSHLLLLVYAVECGLKALLLERRGVHSTEKLADDDLTHDLDGLLRTLGARERFGHATLTSPPGVAVVCENIHQVLRYGGRFETACRTRVEASATSAIAWIEENIT
jgi:hypothetical protein